MTLIGLSGYARSGKDSVASVLVETLDFQRRAFADTLRTGLVALDPTIMVASGINGGLEPWSLAMAVKVYGWEKLKVIAPDCRPYQQRLGTELGRNILGEDVWVNATLGEFDHLDRDIVISDCRFPNEARAIKRRGGYLVRITRPGIGPANDHPSEVGLDGEYFDYYLVNDGSLEDLVDDAEAMLYALDTKYQEKFDNMRNLLSI